MLKTLIVLFKYSGQDYIGPRLAEHMFHHFRGTSLLDETDIVVPVPLSRLKMRERGYNQAGLVAARVARLARVPVFHDLLVKERASLAQAGLPLAQRFSNVRGVFRCTASRGIEGARVLLIDDVMTSGATAQECARVLRSAGADVVRVLTIAHTPNR